MTRLRFLFLESFLVFFVLHISGQTKYYSDSSKYDIKSYTLDLKLSNENTLISGFTSIYAQSIQEQLKTVFLELNPELIVNKILVNKSTCTFSRNKKWLRIVLPQPIDKNNFFTLNINYSGEISTTTSMGGFKSEYMSAWQQHITYTLSEPFGSYLWFPCKQELRDKADSVFINITTKENMKVAANGLLVKTTSIPATKEVRYEWASHYPTAYYLIAVGIAAYDEYNYYIKNEAATDSFLFQNYYFKELDSKSEIDETVDIMHLYERLLLPFPFKKEKYGHCLAPIGGGMENQTMTMVNSFSFALIAHELAHSWFGDMVTCAEWKHIWLNEGITSYMEYLAHEYLKPDLAKVWIKDAFNSAASEPYGTIAIPESELDNELRIFSSHLSYRKGAYMMHQLRQKINNDSTFYLILQTYLNRYAYSNATADDFKEVAEEVSGLSMDQFFSSWIYGAGMPLVNVTWSSDNKVLSLNFSQNKATVNSPIFDLSFFLKIVFENGKDTTIRFNQQLENEGIAIPVYSRVTRIEVPEISEGLVTSVRESSELYFYNIKIYPNPAEDTLYIDFPNSEKNRRIEIIGANGANFGNFDVRNKKNIIRINTLPRGLYLIKIQGHKKAMNIKFVKRIN